MIQQAFISGQLGRAVFTENGQRKILDLDWDGPGLCTSGDLSMFFHSGAEYILLPGPVKDLAQLADSLERETQAHTALTLVLSAMDAGLTETRRLSVEAADELLQDSYVYSFVRRRLLSRPLPAGADLDAAFRHSAEGASVLFALLGIVRQSQPYIHSVLQAWNQVAEKGFSSLEKANDAETALIDHGVFDAMISAIAQGRPEDLNSLIVNCGFDKKISAAVPRVTHLMNAMRPLLTATVPPLERELEKEPAAESIGGGIRELLSRFGEDRSDRPRRRISAAQAKARVDAQIESIAKAIREHNLRRAEEWLRDLVEFHIRHGKKEHLAMSLCNLATIAIVCHEFDFAGVLVEHAAALGIQDPVIVNISAEILRVKGHLSEALQAYNEAAQLFPQDAFARTGRAEVLKAMGRFLEALEAYVEAILLFPENVVARTGRAEVLKAMGRFSEALLAYEEATRLFPENVVARTGRAEVLKAMGRFPEALQAYNEAIFLFPYDAVARNGRAEVFKTMGDFSEALLAYEEATRLFPENVVARTGRAEVLKAMGRFPEALQAYNEAIFLFPNDAVARNGRAEVFKTMGRFPEALQAYESAILLFPNNAVARIGRAEVLKTMGRFPEALQAYEDAIRLFAEVLKTMGGFPEALQAYATAQARFPYDEYARSGSASVLILMDRLAEAKALLSPDVPPVSQGDWVRYHIFSMIDVKSGINLDDAIERLTYGSQHAPWLETRRRFINALAVAWIKRKNYRDTLQLLHSDLDLLEVPEQQKRFTLMGHSYAAINNKPTAIKVLTGLEHAGDPNLVNLRGLLLERYSLDAKHPAAVNFSLLDASIAQHEFALAMA